MEKVMTKLPKTRFGVVGKYYINNTKEINKTHKAHYDVHRDKYVAKQKCYLEANKPTIAQRSAPKLQCECGLSND